MIRGRSKAVQKNAVARSTSKKPKKILRSRSTRVSKTAFASDRIAVKKRVATTGYAHHAQIQDSAPRSIGTPMHPYMRTMFLSLAIGTAGVFASMLYYIHVARATETAMYQNTGSRITAEKALSTVDGALTGLIQDLEEQRKDAGGALPMLPKEYLRLRAEQEGVNYVLLNRIAYCESKWRMVENAKSTAFGYFQILDGTERLTPQYKAGLHKTDPYVNIDMAIALFQKYGTIPWVESQSCWSDTE